VEICAHGNVHLHNCSNNDNVVIVPDPQEPETAEPSCTADEHQHRRSKKPLVNDSALERASRLFRAIGEPARLRLLSRLAQGEMCVTEIAALEKESVSTISQRLRVLRSEDLIVRQRRGKHIDYALADQHVMDLVFNALAHATERPAAIPSNEDLEKENNT
jgi:ArsR family transcriptional regulator, lead/cadmium/zinc/bismuth-responsive transcriptional repressor